MTFENCICGRGKGHSLPAPHPHQAVTSPTATKSAPWQALTLQDLCQDPGGWCWEKPQLLICSQWKGLPAARNEGAIKNSTKEACSHREGGHVFRGSNLLTPPVCCSRADPNWTQRASTLGRCHPNKHRCLCCIWSWGLFCLCFVIQHTGEVQWNPSLCHV